MAAHAALADVLGADPYRRTWHRAQAIVGPDDEVANASASATFHSPGTPEEWEGTLRPQHARAPPRTRRPEPACLFPKLPSILHPPILHPAPPSSTLAAHFQISASMTTAEAYDARVLTSPTCATNPVPKFITTGLIDPRTCLWGTRPVIPRDYHHPRLTLSDRLTPSLQRRAANARRPEAPPSRPRQAH